MARFRFAFVWNDGEGRTDPVVIGDHVEEINGKLVLLDEDGNEVYSGPANKGRFVGYRERRMRMPIGLAWSDDGLKRFT
jgi:hypothetical protein